MEFVPISCPVSRCDGLVVFMAAGEFGADDTDFFGCGSCGSLWRALDSLMREVSRIQQIYSYRKACYTEDRGGEQRWLPGATPPTDCSGRVAEEEPDACEHFERD